MSLQTIRVRDYINSAVKLFSLADNDRSIPALDGLKPSQRKAVYGASTRGENASPMSVERLSAAIAAITDYHHGTVSMESTIAGMGAVKYPGSNNMNLFIPEGQYGSRLTKEPGAGRYIESTLSSHFRRLFMKADDAILDHNTVDGDKIEPKIYLPILPLMLINGATGTGTGHACEIKSYHPEQIRDAVLAYLNGKAIYPGTLIPWFRGFHGTVERNPETGQVVMTGKLTVVNSTTIKITELPVGVFLDQYKDILNKLEEEEFIKSYDDASSEESFEFIVTVPRTTTALSEEQLYQKFKLVGRDTENFTIWNSEGKLVRYNSAEEIIGEFVEWRVPYYEIRRQQQILDVTESVRYQSEVIRFIKFYQSNVKIFRDSGKKALIDLLLDNQFVDYERLLAMAIWNLTKDRIAELEKKLEDLSKELALLEADTANEMYKRELKAFKYDETITT